VFKGLFDAGYKELKRISKIANKIEDLAPEYKLLTDDELKGKTEIYRERYQAGETLDDLLVEAFATVREAATRVLGMTPFKVQLMGAIAMHGGNIAEMKTGEGKTLTSTLTAYLNSLSGEGVHIVTVNEYLADRDAREMGQLFIWLGLTVGTNLRELSAEEKRTQYECDVLYSTNNELGFDYLRDHMVMYKEQMVQRPLSFAIIDEVDSILIDEARTPLIISGGAKNTGNLYQQADMLVKRLKDEEDFTIDVKARHATLTEEGISKAEKFFNLDNLYDVNNVSLLHHINNALRANYIMARDVDYVVQDNTVIIVDSFTGRLMHGRQYSEGLHQALEAKEHVEIKKETRTVATITFQNFFRMYKKLSGMTGTAKTEEEEFRNIYNMYVVEIPTNEPVIRVDAPDLIFISMKAKFEAIASDIEKRYLAGQPVLVGTISIETSEYLSELLTKKRIPHDVLNAKQHEREADIVAKAGQTGAITIATNMAGRGTDIKLGQGVVELGGLAVIGTERHESRRIDNQLRGRSGRQGDPGYTRFYLSAEDDLMRRFGSDRFKTVLSMAVAQKDGTEAALESKMFSRFVESAQKKIEGNNFDARKTVLEYDEVLRVQREIIYEQRNQILFFDDITEEVINPMIDATCRRFVDSYSITNRRDEEIDYEELLKSINGKYFPLDAITIEDLKGKTIAECSDFLITKCHELLNQKRETFSEEVYREFLKVILLRVVDTFWMEHIDEMSELRQAVRLQSYAQINPLREYQEVGFQKFDTMVINIASEAVRYINLAQIRDNLQREAVVKNAVASDGKEDSIKKKPTKASDRVGRNDPCPCGSGKKYKNCHGR
jgi:preprotein translocase subunit SecA